MVDVATILTWTGTLIGGMVAGITAAKKMPLWRNGNGKKDPKPYLEVSARTGGARRISEEGLSKVNELKSLIEDRYMTTEKHTDVCGKIQADMKLHISDELKKHTKEILQAIERNGK